MAEALPGDPVALKRLVAEARAEAFALRTLVHVVEDYTETLNLFEQVLGRRRGTKNKS